MLSQSACAECQRLKLRCDKKGPPCGSCVHRRCDSICPAGTLISSGRGKRSVMSHVPELHSVITEMGERIRQLQEALIIVGVPVQKQKIFLATDFNHLSETTPAQKRDILGSLSVNRHGEAVYFGPTAGCATETNSDNDRQDGSLLFTAVTESFPFSDQNLNWDVDQALDQLFAHLPLEQRAWHLCDIYYRNGGWTGMPVLQSQTIELLSLIYHNIGTEDDGQGSATAHQMAVLFLVFALGALVDLDLPAYNTEADQYFNLASAAMSITSVLEDSTVETVQALTLFACYLGHGGPRFSMNGAWTMISLASQISKKLGLHREGFGSNLPSKLSTRCRALFWETYSIETIYGLSVGRPTGTLLSEVTCPFPPDEVEETEPFVKLFPGYFHARWGYTKNVSAPIMEGFTTASKPSYRSVLEIDQKIRKYIHSCSCERFPYVVNEAPSAYAQRHLISLLSKLHIMHLHIGSFVEAMRDRPDNPFASAYTHSFSAAYMTAMGAIEANKRNFSAHPGLFKRWWPTRESLFNAAFIVGIFATRYPTPKPRLPSTLLGLFTAVDLVEKIMEPGGHGESGWTLIRRLLDKAIKLHWQVNSHASLPLPLPMDPEFDRELEIFAGRHALSSASERFHRKQQLKNPQFENTSRISGCGS
ncbi:Zn(2)-C6 fungal-type domain-containing protein [Mycena sanguinolenta]|uniref:Zn(2)-C6 fungal-type domain-containing protein n=1 Tax=Mycena sanguinolenta TaxID=230812 RepID=A0A8H6YSG9_9AGAR|nr:Zn(2)-C6 fungal-type domain-containing protein [Mycena sanguinolenta]